MTAGEYAIAVERDEALRENVRLRESLQRSLDTGFRLQRELATERERGGIRKRCDYAVIRLIEHGEPVDMVVESATYSGRLVLR